MSTDRPHLLLPAGPDRWIGLFVKPEHAETIKTIRDALKAGYNPASVRCSGFWFKCFDCKLCCQEVLRKNAKGQNYFVGAVTEVCYKCWRKRKDSLFRGDR